MDIVTKVPGLSHISEDIFKLLDKKSLLDCRLVNKAWNKSLSRPFFWLDKSENEYHQFSREFGNLSNQDFFQKSTNNIKKWKTLVGKIGENQLVEKDCVLVLMKIFKTRPKQNKTTWFKKIWTYYFSLKKNSIQGKFQTFPKHLEIVVKLGDANKYSDLVKFMLQNISEWSRVEAHGFINISPLQLTAFYGFTDLFKFMTKRDNFKSNNAIHFAAQNGKLDTVKYLACSCYIEWVNPITTLKDGSTPIHCAAKNGHLEIVKILAVYTDKPNMANMNGWTPIYYAAEKGHLEIVKFLVRFTDFPNAADQNGNTPIYIAARNGHLDIVKFLVDFTDTPNAANGIGWTPIHTACKNGHLNIVKFLVDLTDNPNALSNSGWTPMRLANKYGHFKVHTFLAFHLLKKTLNQ